MVPFLRPGDAIWAESAEPASLRRGDVVVIWHPAELVTHRLVAADAGGWYAKGDNRRHLDPLVGRGAVLGRVVAIERDGNLIELRSRRWMVANWLLGVVSLCEARAFDLGRRVKGRLFGKKGS